MRASSMWRSIRAPSKVFVRLWPLPRLTRITPLSCNGLAVVQMGITRTKISINLSLQPTLPFGPILTYRSLLALDLRVCGLILPENGLLSTARNLMPFDGVLLGSWVIIEKEAHTSDSVEEILVHSQGFQ